MTLVISNRQPTVREYNALRASVHWPLFEEQIVQEALTNSLYSVVAEEENTAVGMGRVVGDGAIYLHIQDVIVHPSFQGKGIGKAIMQNIMTFILSHGGKNTNIGLMSSKGRENFYESFGFTVRPNERFGAGMIMIR